MTAVNTETKIVTAAATLDKNTEDRFKAVRSVKNRFRYRIQKRINLYTRSIALAKDKNKIKILTAKVEALTFALSTVDGA